MQKVVGSSPIIRIALSKVQRFPYSAEISLYRSLWRATASSSIEHHARLDVAAHLTLLAC